MLAESFQIAFRALGTNKLRTTLTMLGIIIGVAAVIALTALGQGVSDFIAGQFADIGTNLVFVFPGKYDPARPGRTLQLERLTLTLEDAAALEDPARVPGLVAVAPLVRGDGVVTYQGR